MRRLPKIIFCALVLLLLPFGVRGQETEPPQAAATPQQIDQLVAPIALYPDPLVAQIMMAATYPLEIVEANRWLQNPQNAQLKGDQLTEALTQQSWDPSVKSLVAFPQVLTMMDNNLRWTEQLGNVFLGQQAAVMDSIQRLRQMAQSAGSLSSTQEQTVTTEGSTIAIQPTDPQVVYVPSYDPRIAYGAWPYPDYEPYYFPYAGPYYDESGFLAFGVGVAVIGGLWGWSRWDWYHHRIDIDDHRFSALNRGRDPSASGVWSHDPAHRRGVPYASPAAREQFRNTGINAANRDVFRGYAPRTNGGIVNRVRVNSVDPNAAGVRRGSNLSVSEQPYWQGSHPQQQNVQPYWQGSNPQQRVQPYWQGSNPQQQRPPVFESFSRGSDVRMQSQRGANSRANMSAASAAHAGAPARGGGGGGGHGGGARGR